jgi:hypothetical protein
MNKNIILTIILSLCMLFGAASCENNSETTNNNVRTADFGLQNTFLQGNGGLTFEFQKNSPPEIVRDQGLEPFFVRFYVENKGEFNIPKDTAFIAISGFNFADLNLNQNSLSLKELRGVKIQGSTGQIPGGSQLVTFSNLRYKKEVIGSNFPMTIYTDICYPYETEAVTVVCVNGNTIITTDETNKICELDDNNLQFANSAAPVKIQNVRQNRNGEHSILLTFDIVHIPLSSKSDLYGRDSFKKDCSLKNENSQFTEKNKVKYILTTGLSGSINCDLTGTNSNSIILYSSQGSDKKGSSYKYTASCEISTQGLGEFYTPMKINLEYAYRERKSKSISIQHIRLAGK